MVGIKIYCELKTYDKTLENVTAKLLADFIKYKALWNLRFLEDEIIKENGIIIVSVMHENKPEFKINGFSENLENQIIQILSRIDFMPFA